MFFALNELEIRGVEELQIVNTTTLLRVQILPLIHTPPRVRTLIVTLADYDIPRSTNDRGGFMSYLATSLLALQKGQRYGLAPSSLILKCAVSYPGVFGRPTSSIRVLRVRFDMVDLAGSWRTMMASIDEELRARPGHLNLRVMRHNLLREKANFELHLGISAP